MLFFGDRLDLVSQGIRGSPCETQTCKPPPLPRIPKEIFGKILGSNNSPSIMSMSRDARVFLKVHEKVQLEKPPTSPFSSRPSSAGDEVSFASSSHRFGSNLRLFSIMFNGKIHAGGSASRQTSGHVCHGGNPSWRKHAKCAGRQPTCPTEKLTSTRHHPNIDSSQALNHMRIKAEQACRRRGSATASLFPISELSDGTKKSIQVSRGLDRRTQEFADLEGISKAPLLEHKQLLPSGRPNSLVDYHTRRSECLVFDHLKVLLSELDIPHQDSAKHYHVAWAFEAPSSKPKPSPVFDSIACEMRQLQTTGALPGQNLKERTEELQSVREARIALKTGAPLSHHGKRFGRKPTFSLLSRVKASSSLSVVTVSAFKP